MLVNSSIAPYIVRSRSVLDCIEKYIYSLRHDGSATATEHADKLKEYRQVITDSEFQRMLEDQFNDYLALILRRLPTKRVILEGRQKSLVSFDNKIVKCQKDGVPLADIKDIMAFRAILLNSRENPMVEELYWLAELTIEFFLLKGFEIVPAGKPKGTGFEAQAHPDVYVPEKSLLGKKYQKFVKDYVANPKTKGYQSLHIVVLDPVTNRHFEIQLRTLYMHAFAETGDASHFGYEIARMKSIESVEIDPTLINMDGFIALKRKVITSDDSGVTEISEKVEITDKIGLFNSVNILLHNK